MSNKTHVQFKNYHLVHYQHHDDYLAEPIGAACLHEPQPA